MRYTSKIEELDALASPRRCSSRRRALRRTRGCAGRGEAARTEALQQLRAFATARRGDGARRPPRGAAVWAPPAGPGAHGHRRRPRGVCAGRCARSHAAQRAMGEEVEEEEEEADEGRQALGADALSDAQLHAAEALVPALMEPPSPALRCATTSDTRSRRRVDCYRAPVKWEVKWSRRPWCRRSVGIGAEERRIGRTRRQAWGRVGSNVCAGSARGRDTKKCNTPQSLTETRRRRRAPCLHRDPPACAGTRCCSAASVRAAALSATPPASLAPRTQFARHCRRPRHHLRPRSPTSTRSARRCSRRRASRARNRRSCWTR